MKIPEHLKGKDLFKFLVDNKKSLINEKKSMPIKFSDGFQSSPIKINTLTKSGAIKDANADDDTEDPNNTDIIRVEVIANTCLWMDSQRDVLLIDSSKRTIKDRKQFMVHISNHDYRLQSKIGEVVDVQLRMFKWSDLGVNLPGSTQCIVFITDVMKSYDEKIFNQYKAGKIDQHSIGLQYVTIELAINDPDYEKEIDFWNKYIDSVGNKDEAIELGYFWVVSEIKLLENSSVLFGSNILTPTISTTNESKAHPSEDIESSSIEDIGAKDDSFSISKLLTAF